MFKFIRRLFTRVNKRKGKQELNGTYQLAEDDIATFMYYWHTHGFTLGGEEQCSNSQKNSKTNSED